MKRIAIDCRPLLGHRSGIGRYVYELLREFAERQDDVEYYLYAPGQIEVPEKCLSDRRFHVRVRHFRPAILWLHCVVPRWLKADRIDVFWGPNYALPLVSFGKRRYIITIHDATFARFPETMYWVTRLHNRWMLPWYGRRADLILTDSNFSKTELEATLDLGKKVRVVYLAARRREGWPEVETMNIATPFVLAVGTVEPRKNFDRLIFAFSLLPLELRERFQLVIAGAPGWGDVDLRARVVEVGLERNVVLTGRVTEGQLAYLYSHAHAVVVPSVYEGFGLPILEAMSFRNPVTCSYNSSVGEVAGSAALLFDPSSVQDIAGKLELLLDDLELQGELCARGEERGRAFSWMRSAEETLTTILEG